MSPIWILVTGMAIVVGGILVLRLHAFLALLLGALVVSALTPRETLFERQIADEAVAWTAVGDGLVLDAESRERVFVVLRPESERGAWVEIGTVAVQPQSDGRLRAELVQGMPALRSGDRVVPETVVRNARRFSERPFGAHVADGFGQTALAIGILIAMAAVIGRCLLESGGAARVVQALQRVFGVRRSGPALAAGAFLTAIPVFFDTVFYLLLPIARAMHLRTGKNYLLYVLAIVAGGTMAHSLIPPTPGPLFVANELGVDIGLMILGGLVVGAFTSTSGYLYARWADRRWHIPLRPSIDVPSGDLPLETSAEDRPLPSLGLSLAPILLPVLLIAGGTMIELAPGVDSDGPLVGFFGLFGEKNVALVLGAASALVLLRRRTSTGLSESVQAALASGGVIILITSAGGAFGHALRLSGIDATLQDWVPATSAGLLPLAFALTALVRIAQGSATVAMITSVGIFAPIVASAALPFHPVYVALAIGCGSKPVSWMNDSGFWIIGRMAGLTEAETLRTSSAEMALMGFVGLAVVMVLAWLAPLV